MGSDVPNLHARQTVLNPLVFLLPEAYCFQPVNSPRCDKNSAQYRVACCCVAG